jgi:hypothetical protein
LDNRTIVASPNKLKIYLSKLKQKLKMNSKFSRKVVAIGLTLTTAVWFAGSVMPAFAQSQSTIDALMAQIAALQAQILALQGSSASASTSSYSFTRDLTVGSKGADVTALQQILVSGGYLKMPTGVAYGYFGSLTKTAVAAWQKAAGVPNTGYFGPKSRAAIASTAPGGPVVVVPGSGMVVSMAADNPSIGSVAIGGINVPMLKLYFTAGASAPVTVTQFSVVRGGLSQDADLNNVYLYDGSTRLASNLGINQGNINFSNASGIFTVNAGQTKEITVSADISSGAIASHIINLSVVGASAITATGAISGAFPIMSNNATLTTVSNLATLTVSGYSSSTVNINAGQQNYLIGQFNVQAGNNPVKVTSLRFTNVGTVDTGLIQNIKILNGATQLGATIPSMPSTNVLSFDLTSNPLMLTSGQSVQLNIYADVMGGTGRAFELTLQQASDIQAVDNMYGVGIGASLVSGSVFPVYLASNSILNGGLVMSRNANSPTTYVVAGNTNQVLAKFDILASGDAVKINQLVLALTASTAASTTNIRVIDDQGAQLGSTITTGAATMYVPGSTAATNNLQYVIPANVTRTLTVYGDIASTVTGTIEVDITSGGSAQSYTNYTSVTVGMVAGYQLSVLASSSNLVAAANYSLGTPVISAGTRQAKIASFNLTAGQINPVSLTGVTIQVRNDAAIAAWLQNVTVKNGTTQIGFPLSIPTASSSNTYNVVGSPIAIAANGTVTIDVYADISNAATTTSTPAVITLAAVSATAAGNAVTIVNTPGQQVSFATGGTLTATKDSSSPAAQFVGMGISGNTLATFRFATNNQGSVNLTKVTLVDSTSTGTSTPVTSKSDFINYRLMNGSTQVAAASEDANSQIAFNLAGSGLLINSDSYANLSVVADTNTYPYASSSATHYMTVLNYIYTKPAGSITATSTAAGSAFTVYRTSLNAATASVTVGSGSGSAYSRYLVGAFTFTAGASYDAEITSVSLKQLISNASTTATTTLVTLYDVTNNTDLGTTTASTSGATAATKVISFVVPAGQSRTMYVYSDVQTGSFTTKPTSSSASITDQISLTTFLWSDGSGQTSIGPNPTLILPVAGSASPAVIVQ